MTDDPTGEMRFHEWELTPEEAASIREFNRYAEIWNSDGKSILRTRYITQDLPLDTPLWRGMRPESSSGPRGGSRGSPSGPSTILLNAWGSSTSAMSSRSPLPF